MEAWWGLAVGVALGTVVARDRRPSDDAKVERALAAVGPVLAVPVLSLRSACLG